MRRLVFQRSALQDLREILGYVERQGRDRAVATRFVELLKNRCRHLAGLPGTLGRSRPDLGDNIRGFPVRGYILVFRYEPGILRVIRILEGHRDPRPSLIDPTDGTPPA